MNPQLVSTYLGLLTSKYSSGATNLSSFGLQTTQQHSINQYGNQLSLNSNGIGISNASLVDASRSISQWENNAISELASVLASNSYTPEEKLQTVQLAQQNPAFINALQNLGNSSLANQLKASFSSLNFNLPMTEHNNQSEAFGQVTPDVSATSSSDNPLLSAQNSLVYTSQAPTNPESSVETLHSNQYRPNEKRKDDKKIPRKPRSNSKRSKEPTTVDKGITAPIEDQEVASNSNSSLSNSFNNRQIAPSVENILNQQLSIQSQLPLPKETQQSFHSPF